MAPAAIKACYSDFKLVRTRGQVQIIFEVPVEQSNEALQVLGGMPNSAESSWFAIARLQEPKSETEKPQREKKRWEDMTAAQQAGILCNDMLFHKFLSETGRLQVSTERFDSFTEASETVKRLCGVKSKREINEGGSALVVWECLVGDYRAWQHEPEYV